ncbi:MAG: hypothetical protein IPN10_08585 [Saprospiraceae bacterium]|nr:hypothetical protein [Saprospiraceae bacterium]
MLNHKVAHEYKHFFSQEYMSFTENRRGRGLVVVGCWMGEMKIRNVLPYVPGDSSYNR